MDGLGLFLLAVLIIGIMPTLGFFSSGGILTLLVLLIFMSIGYLKRIVFNFPQKYFDLFGVLILIYSAFYYGGFYQTSFQKSIGQIPFFIMIIYIILNKYIFKVKIQPIILTIFYLIISWWTLFSSPHPTVDTVVQFKEASLKVLQGINPYNTTYSRAYQNIKPDYYNQFPFSFLIYIPFVLLPIDQRWAIVVMTIGIFLLSYRRVDQKERNNSLIPLSLFLFMPGSFFMLEHLYLDTVVFFFFILAVYFYPISERLFYLFLSIFFNIKQNLYLALPFIISRKILKRGNWIFFLIPFLIIFTFFIWNPQAFLNNTVLGLAPNRITSPIQISLTFSTYLTYFLHPFFPVSLVRNICFFLFILIYILILIKDKSSSTQKTIMVLFCSYFFSYYAFFNSYYLVALFLLYETVRNNYFSKELKTQLP